MFCRTVTFRCQCLTFTNPLYACKITIRCYVKCAWLRVKPHFATRITWWWPKRGGDGGKSGGSIVSCCCGSTESILEAKKIMWWKTLSRTPPPLMSVAQVTTCTWSIQNMWEPYSSSVFLQKLVALIKIGSGGHAAYNLPTHWFRWCWDYPPLCRTNCVWHSPRLHILWEWHWVNIPLLIKMIVSPFHNCCEL